MKEIQEKKMAPPIKSARMTEQNIEKFVPLNYNLKSYSKKRNCLFM